MRANYDFSRGKRGAIVRAPKGKTRITIRLDDDILDWFRARVDEAGGGNYQTLINDALRAFMAGQVGQDEPLDVLVRRIVREELKRSREPRRARGAKAA